MKFLFSCFLFLVFIFPFNLITTFAQAQSLEDEPCLYGIRTKGECNPEPDDFSAEESLDQSIDPNEESDPCLCGISLEEEGVCLDSCEALDEMERETEEHLEATRL